MDEGWPSGGFCAPLCWSEELATSDPGHCKLSSDFCQIREPGTEHRHSFIRCLLEIKIQGIAEPFLWGVWVTQSDTNFRDYIKSFPNSPERTTFGYLSNR